MSPSAFGKFASKRKIVSDWSLILNWFCMSHRRWAIRPCYQQIKKLIQGRSTWGTKNARIQKQQLGEEALPFLQMVQYIQNMSQAKKGLVLIKRLRLLPHKSLWEKTTRPCLMVTCLPRMMSAEPNFVQQLNLSIKDLHRSIMYISVNFPWLSTLHGLSDTLIVPIRSIRGEVRRRSVFRLVCAYWALLAKTVLHWLFCWSMLALNMNNEQSQVSIVI